MQALRLTGSVAELHVRDPFAGGSGAARGAGPEACQARVWWCDFSDPAIVLGSAQRADLLDAEAVAGDRLSVVTRRSGGGAVLLVPGAVVWIDLIVPAGTPGWPDDVRGSMVAAGELWRAALGEPGLTVHDGAMVTNAWSRLVCFAGIGPGEVLEGTRKLVGLSQRRTRHGARIQGQLHTRSLVTATARYIAAAERPPDLPAEAAVRAVAGGDLAGRLAAELERTTQA